MKLSLFQASLLLLSVVSADKAPLQKVLQSSNPPIEKTVAIIGGGASGTSTAFWLSNVFPRENNVHVTTTLFERNDYIGGRSTAVPIKGDPALGIIELGASIFVEANKHLMTATEKFNLKRTKLSSIEDDKTVSRPGLGVWDGSEFLLEDTGSFWNKVKAFWRYGLTTLKFTREQKNSVERFLAIYDQKNGYESVDKMVEELGFTAYINQTAAEYLKQQGINENFVHEVLQTAARGNYCQDLNILHVFAVMVSMEAGHGTWAVESGNYRIFEEFAKRSGANIMLETTVTSVTNITEIDVDGNDITRFIVETSNGDAQIFDDVVVAAPLHKTNIQFPFKTQQHHRDYHTVHVTLVAGHSNPEFFGRTLENLPTFIVSTGEPLVEHFEGGAAFFNTFSEHRYLENGETVFKLFSPEKLTNEQLETLFVNTSWVYHKAWHAFPRLYPIQQDDNTFAPFILKANEDDESGIVYTGAFETFISTMETQTISGKNAARLLYDKWCNVNHKFNKNCRAFGDGWGRHY